MNTKNKVSGSLQQKNGKYYAVIRYYNEDNKQVQKWISLNLPVKNNKTKAQRTLSDLKRELENQLKNKSSVDNLTFVNFIVEFNELKKQNLSVTTYNNYCNIIKKHIEPFFKNTLLKNISAGILEEYYQLKTTEGLSAKTVRNHHCFIHAALKQAFKKRYIDYNYADLADKPKRSKPQVAEPYSVEEMNKLLKCVQETELEPVIILAVSLGLRRSEILGLKWSNVDFENRRIYITTTLVNDNSKTDKISVRERTKTLTSKRILPIPENVFSRLLTIKEKQAYYMNVLKSAYNTNYIDFVCTHNNGNIIKPDYVTKKFSHILEVNNLRKIRFHDLRHSCATALLNNGVDLKHIQSWLGHSNYNFTADTYTHTQEAVKESLADIINNALNIF